MSGTLMNTKEVASYLDIHEKQVYQLIKAGKIPCTKVTGKWMFPLKVIDEWIASGLHVGGASKEKMRSGRNGMLAAGSNDPVVDMLLSAMKKDHPDFHIFSANTGSVKGLVMLNDTQTDIAFSHLYDPETGQYNTPYLGQYCPDVAPVVVNLFHRQVGFVLSKTLAGRFSGWADLTDENVRFVNRQEGSGIRHLIDHALIKLCVSPGQITGYDLEVCTHFEVGLAIAAGQASVGIASAAVAKILDLTFMPLVEERFDMILSRDTFFQPELQAFIDTLQSDRFRKTVQKIGQYDFRDSGKILHS